MGGDGTLRECAAGILGSDASLAFLPTGTMNVMALELGVPSRAVEAARGYANAREVRLGVGLAAGTPFLMQVSAGIDAALIRSLRPKEKQWLGRVSVVPAIVRALAGYGFPLFEVESASGVQSVTLVVASNIRRYGGPFVLTPRATSDGTGLELFLFSGRGRGAAITFGLSLLLGRHSRIRTTSVKRIREATITAGANVPFQMDGDILGLSPGRAAPQSLAVSLSAETLRVLVPA